MSWDSFPRVVDGRKRTAKQILQEELEPRAIAVYVNLSSGTAYAAVPDGGGKVHGVFYRAEAEIVDGESWVAFKALPIDESPVRWPAAVADVIPHW